MKPIRLQVQMPTIGMFSIKGRSGVGEVEQMVETTAISLRRRVSRGVHANDYAMALVYVPEQFRRHLRETKRLVGEEYAWCVAKLVDNKKSLAPFMASGDREWKSEGSSVSAIKVNTSRTNTTTHRAVVHADEIKRLLGEGVCQQIGIDPGGKEETTVSVQFSNRTSNFGSELEALVIVTIRHETSSEAAGE